MSNDRLEGLLEVLDLEEVDRDRYRGNCEPHLHGRIFGGQVLSQALVAAARTIETNDSACKLAPPTSAPSTLVCASSVGALSGLTLPPYKIRVRSATSEL